MRFEGCLLLGLFATPVSAQLLTLDAGSVDTGGVGANPQVAFGCNSPTTVHNTWYVSPTGNDTTGDGSQSKPWTLTSIFSSGAWGGARLITYPTAHGMPATGGVTPGDQVLLETGSYGQLTLTSGAVNSDWVTFGAALGATPVLSRLHIQNVAINKLRFTGLTFRNDGVAVQSLIDLGIGTDIMIDHNDVADVDDATSLAYTTTTQWETNVTRQGINVDGRGGGSCTTVANNLVHSVATGIGGPQPTSLRVADNELAYFNRDGIDVSGFNVEVVHNYIHDNELTSASHADAIQGQWSVGNPTFSNILIDSNIIDQVTGPQTIFSAYIQGIDAFDGDWQDIKVIRNVVRVSATQALSWGAGHYVLFAYNTILWNGLSGGSDPVQRPFNVSHQFGVSDHVVSINNITANGDLTVQNGANGVNPTSDPALSNSLGTSNLVFTNFTFWNTGTNASVNTSVAGTYRGNQVLGTRSPSNVFVNLGQNSLGYAAFDLHLAGGSPALTLGITSAAELTAIVAQYPNLALPPTDATGRTYGTAIGAYAP